MAVDEYLYSSLPDAGQTYVRFYQWAKPTVSLGYYQDAAKVVDLDFCDNHGVDVVRRITGGKLVLHDQEVTYSLCSSDEETFGSSLAGSYRLISEALVLGLNKMGINARLAGSPPPAYTRGTLPCFSYPAQDEIEINGKKLIGSAQRRIGRRFLQHGSIPLLADDGALARVSLGEGGEAGARMTSLSDATGRPMTFDEAVLNFVEGISEYFRVNFVPKNFDGQDIASIQQIQRGRYGNRDWTYGRKSGLSIDFFYSK